MYKKKYQKGRIIKSIGQLENLLEQEAWIYYRHQPYHPGWVESWTYRFIRIAIEKQQLFIADKYRK